MRKKLFGISFALLLALTTFTSSALAHECIIYNRSDQGNINAANSANWVNIGSLDSLFTHINEFLGSPTALTPNQVAWAVGVARAQGLPEQVTVFTRKVLLEGTPLDGTPKMTDGKGIDHLFDYSPTVIEIYFAALQRPA